jgi:hypothetical protein
VKDAGGDAQIIVDGLWRRVPYALLIAALLTFGFAPRLLTDKVKPSVALMLENVFGKTGKTAAPVLQAATEAR